MYGWLRCAVSRPGAAVRLVCFPHAGGSAGFFAAWSRLAAPGIEVHTVQYPGREDRIIEAPEPDMACLAGCAAAALDGSDDRPLALFGHSMGAAVAYEVARLLDREPVHLFASGRHSPGEVVPGGVHLRDDAGLVADLARLGGTGAGLLAMPEVLEVVLPAVRNDYRLIETYHELPGRRLGCPVTALIGTEDPEVDAGQARRWAAHTTGPFDLVELPGAHFYLDARRTEVLDVVEAALHGVPTRP